MLISTKLGPWVSEDGFLFSEEKIDSSKDHSVVFSLFLTKNMHTITYYSMIGIVRSDKAPVPNVDISYLPKCTEFF